jgi:hypothetical protein
MLPLCRGTEHPFLSAEYFTANFAGKWTGIALAGACIMRGFSVLVHVSCMVTSYSFVSVLWYIRSRPGTATLDVAQVVALCH